MTGPARVALRRIFRVVNGGTPKADPANWDGGIQWATPVDLANFNGSHLGSTLRTLSPTGLRSGSAAVPANSLIVSTRAPIGYVVQTRGSTAFNQGCKGLVPERSVDIRFYRYVLIAMKEQLTALGQGSTFAELSGDALSSLIVPAPPLRLQRVIADYLDTETARIDALIAKKQQLLELVARRFWASVENDIRSSSRGDVPLRRLLMRIIDGPFGSSLTSAHYVDSGPRVVRLGNIGFAEFKNEDRAHISEEHYAALQGHRVRQGDLLIAGLGDARNHVGRGCVAPALGSAIVKADCYCAAVDPTRAIAEFIAFFLSSRMGANAVSLAARGTTRSRINLDIAKEIRVPVVPLEEQLRLVGVFRLRREHLNRLDVSLRRQLERLAEHRQTLIAAAVTGELEISGAA